MLNDTGYSANLYIPKDNMDVPYIQAKIPVSEEYIKQVMQEGRLINVQISSCLIGRDAHGFNRCSLCGNAVNEGAEYCPDCGATLIW